MRVTNEQLNTLRTSNVLRETVIDFIGTNYTEDERYDFMAKVGSMGMEMSLIDGKSARMFFDTYYEEIEALRTEHESSKELACLYLKKYELKIGMVLFGWEKMIVKILSDFTKL